MEKFQNKYRIQSARHQHWDYSWAGAYFITICTANRYPFFGKITAGKMVLSNIGILANVFWHEIKNHSKNVTLGEYVVMPNHVHGILILGGDGTDESVNNNTDAVETRHALSLPGETSQPPKTTGQQRFQNQGKNTVSSIVGSYKSAVTRHARRLGFKFGWQSRFHDHIIRNEKSFDNISNYIIHNPDNWEKDKFYLS